MALKLTTADHRAMDKYLDAVLDGYKNGDLTLSTARADLAHAMSAAAIDNEGFKDYIRLEVRDKWKGILD